MGRIAAQELGFRAKKSFSTHEDAVRVANKAHKPGNSTPDPIRGLLFEA